MNQNAVSCIDELGVVWYSFNIEFTNVGLGPQPNVTYGFNIWATSFDHAQEQLAFIKMNAHVESMLICEEQVEVDMDRAVVSV